MGLLSLIERRTSKERIADALEKIAVEDNLPKWTINDAVKFLRKYKKFVEEFWGPRCSDYEPDCHCCKAWRRFDAEFEAIDYVK